MKDYPSIPASTGTAFREIPGAYVFDKYDGSNLRWEWNRKKGWFKQGTRTRLFDATDEIFGCAIPVFRNALAEPVEKIARDSRWDSLIVFTEFHGPRSFAGLHEPDDPKALTLFDVNVYKKGIMGPKEFLKTFGHLEFAARCLGQYNWTRGFVQTVREDRLEGVTFEGVVGKAGEGHKLVMAKAKTQRWIDTVRAKFTPEDAEKIINS